MVRLITDSSADLEPREYEQLNITCIPLNVVFDGTEYQENVNLSKDRFYELLLSSGQSPKTAQPSPQYLLDLFEEAHNAGDSAIYVCLSSATAAGDLGDFLDHPSGIETFFNNIVRERNKECDLIA